MSCCCCCCAADPEDEPADRAYRSFADTTDRESVGSASGAVSRADFEVLALLGRGSYGKVLHVRKKDTGELYAMKVMSKADIFKRNQVRHALTERSILRTVRHPFIVPLHFAFQSSRHLYLVMGLQSGGELFFHLRREGAFASPRVRLYAAEILLALEALHAAGFIYRDLKPENVPLLRATHTHSALSTPCTFPSVHC